MVARAATAQDDMTGDGTTSTVILIGELMKLGERLADENLHPRVISQGFDAAKKEVIRVRVSFTHVNDVGSSWTRSSRRLTLTGSRCSMSLARAYEPKWTPS